MDGADISEICAFGDSLIDKELAALPGKKTKKLEKGIAIPTCISVDNICGNYSPFADESTSLADGQIVKVELGAHIDGYIAFAGDTISIGEDKVTGRKADVILAASTALNAAIRTIVKGATNEDVTKVVAKVAEEYKC